MPNVEFSNSREVFFSIVIASFNDINCLTECIKSIQEQSFDNYELLISDGGSIDGTVEFMEQTRPRNLTWSKSTPDRGIYDALNIALDHVSGRWILVLGADDRLADPDALMRAFRQIENIRGKFGIVYSDLIISEKSKVRLKKYPDFEEFERRYNGGAFIHHQTAFVARDDLLSCGKFSLSYKIHADYDLMLKVIKRSGAIKIEGRFVVFNAHGYSSKLRNIWMSFVEIRTIRKSHQYLHMPPRLFISYCVLLIRRIFRL